jgi:hypothetical protein
MFVTFCKTKAGNGFKIVVNGKWLYASKRDVLEVIDDEVPSCCFKTIDFTEDEE